MYKQIIIARRDLMMSPGKLAAQVSHASMAFLTNAIKRQHKKLLDKDISIGTAWEYSIVPDEQLEKAKQTIEEIRHREDEITVHRNGKAPEESYVPELIDLLGKKYTKRPQWYRRADLHNWAKEARKNGQEQFYYTCVNPNDPFGELKLCDPKYHYEATLSFDTELYEQWINGSFTKCILGAKNKNQLLKAKDMALEMGMTEGKDFFLIKDNCYTELEPEETDENGIGRTLTCIGFAPMEDKIIDNIGKKYHLY